MRHKATDSVVRIGNLSVIQLRYRTVWSGI